MCEVCAVFGIGDHWTEAAKLADGMFPAPSIQRHRRDRRQRIALINRILQPSGLACIDWDGEAFALEDRSGRRVIAPSLPEIWREAERLSGRTFDPLAAEL